MKEKVLVDVFRREMTEKVAQFFATNGEDVGYVNSNTINFPVLIGDIEKWVEVTIKVPKGTKDEEMVLKEGDTVLYGKYAGTELEFEGKKYLIMRQSDVVAVLA